mgnify:CR=1 FL=1
MRQALQAKGTRSAKRHLKRLAGMEARFRRNTNHVISKRIVTKAEGTARAIALEDLKGIRDRVTVRKGQRARHGSWAFHQLRAFIEYKAERAGVPVIAVDPRNTSRTCPKLDCGHCDKHNRPSQAEFRCVACGFVSHADHVGAVNVGRRGEVTRPIVSRVDAGTGTVRRADTPPSADASLAL